MGLSSGRGYGIYGIVVLQGDYNGLIAFLLIYSADSTRKQRDCKDLMGMKWGLLYSSMIWN